MNLTITYSFIQAFYWMNFAAMTGFTSVYLLHTGFSNTQIGILIAVAGAVASLLQPVLASYADHPKSPSLKKIVMGWTVVLLLLAALLLPIKKSFVLTALLYGAALSFLQMLTPLLNSLGMESLNQGKVLNYGVARGIGSGAYAAASYVLGILVARFGEKAVPLAMLVGFTAFLAALFVFPFRKTKTQKPRETAQSDAGPLLFFRRYKRFTLTLCGCVFIYVSHVLLNNFAYQIVESKGGGSSQMGLGIALAAVMELPTMFLFGHMLKKARADVWFRLSGIFFLLKALGTLLAPNMPIFYAVQVFQMFGWALITVASVYYVNSIMEEQDAIKGQAYMTMTYTLGCVLGALIGGALIDAAGVNAMLLFAVLSGLVGMVIVMVTAGPNNFKKKLRN